MITEHSLEMPSFWMQHSVSTLATNNDADANACPNSDVCTVCEVSGTCFVESGGIDVCFKSNNIEVLAERTKDVRLSPVRFWGGCDIPVSGESK